MTPPELTADEARALELAQQVFAAEEALESFVTARRLDTIIDPRTARTFILRDSREAIRTSEVMYRRFAEQSPCAVAMLDGDSRYLAASQRWVREHQLPADFVGRSFFDLSPLAPDRWREAFQRGLAGETVEQADDELRLPSGHLLALRWTAQPWRTLQGRVGGLLISAEVENERRAAQRQLRRQVARTALLSDMARAIAAQRGLEELVDTALGLVEAQLPADASLFYLRDAATGAWTLAAVGAGLGAGAREACAVERALELLRRCEAEATPPDTLEVSRPDRLAVALAARGVEALVAVPLAVEGQLVGLLVVGRRAPGGFQADEREFLAGLGRHAAIAVRQARVLGALRDALDTLRRTQEQVLEQERLRALGQMASGIAHDLNNRLQLLVGYSDLLRQDEPALDAATRRRFAEHIHAAALDGAQVVRRLKDFYRSRDPDEPVSAVSLPRIVEECIGITEPRWRGEALAAGAAIRIETRLAPVPVVQGSAGDLRELLTNLILNAVDAMPAGGVLSLATSLEGEHVVLEVRDTGSGMTPEVRRRCLEPFFTTKGSRGTGLGLSLVHGAVRRHGGALEIESEPGRGTRIRARFPVAPAAPDPSAAQPRAGAPPPLRRTVLVVDDEELLRELLRRWLEAEGLEVVSAADGQEALALARQRPFDVVVTDAAMPRLSGEQLAVALQEARSTARVVLLTGFGDLMLAQGRRPPGVDLVASKPITRQGLRCALDKVLASAGERLEP